MLLYTHKTYKIEIWIIKYFIEEIDFYENCEMQLFIVYFIVNNELIIILSFNTT